MQKRRQKWQQKLLAYKCNWISIMHRAHSRYSERLIDFFQSRPSIPVHTYYTKERNEKQTNWHLSFTIFLWSTWRYETLTEKKLKLLSFFLAIPSDIGWITGAVVNNKQNGDSSWIQGGFSPFLFFWKFVWNEQQTKESTFSDVSE